MEWRTCALCHPGPKPCMCLDFHLPRSLPHSPCISCICLLTVLGVFEAYSCPQAGVVCPSFGVCFPRCSLPTGEPIFRGAPPQAYASPGDTCLPRLFRTLLSYPCIFYFLHCLLKNTISLIYPILIFSTYGPLYEINALNPFHTLYFFFLFF